MSLLDNAEILFPGYEIAWLSVEVTYIEDVH